MQAPLDPHSALLGAAELLRKLCQDRRAPKVGVIRGSDARLLALLDPATQRIYAIRALERIVDSLSDGSATLAELDPAQDHTPRSGGRLVDETLERLAWLLGARLAQHLGLAPWLDPGHSYRLQRWPDFGEIGSDPQGAQLCRVIAERHLGIEAMAEAAQLPQRSVHGLLNSLSLCGILESAPKAPPSGARPPRGLSEAAQPHGLKSSAAPPAALPDDAPDAAAAWPPRWLARAWRRLRASSAA